MADWKKVAVSGSQVDLNIITASGDISASGKWYANLDTSEDQTYLVTYDRDTGEFGYRLLETYPGAPS